jgi:hypothetical protein
MKIVTTADMRRSSRHQSASAFSSLGKCGAAVAEFAVSAYPSAKSSAHLRQGQQWRRRFVVARKSRAKREEAMLPLADPRLRIAAQNYKKLAPLLKSTPLPTNARRVRQARFDLGCPNLAIFKAGRNRREFVLMRCISGRHSRLGFSPSVRGMYAQAIAKINATTAGDRSRHPPAPIPT